MGLILAVKSVHMLRDTRIDFSSFFLKQSKGECIAGDYILNGISQGLVILSAVLFSLDVVLHLKWPIYN